MQKTLLPVLALILMAPSLALAAASEAEKQTACQADAIHLCSEFIPDREKIALCMQKKMSELSTACRAIFEEEANDKTKSK